jgi:hypothetical protein
LPFEEKSILDRALGGLLEKRQGENDDPQQKLGRGMLEKSSKTTQSESGKSAVLPIRKATGRGNLAAEIDG